jgi:predicted AAA+ superfamily ATPase
MPALPSVSDAEKRDWLHSYALTYLERDLSDLAQLHDYTPFHTFQRLAALRSGQVLSYAALARDAGVSPGTAKNYLRYLELSYQLFLLPPFFSNQTKRLVKSQKLYWVDVGLWREQTGMWGDISGALLETFVIAECYKWVKTMQRAAELSFFRVHSGTEVDLVVANEYGVWGIEIKSRLQASRSQARSLRAFARHMGEKWRGGLVVYRGNVLHQLEENIWAMPAARLFSPT